MDKIPPHIRAKIPAVVQNQLVSLEKQLDQVPQLQMIEEKAKVPKLFLVLGLGVLIILILALDFFGELISNLVGLVYPAYATFKALESSWQIEHQRFWLTYWLVLAVVNTVEYFTPAHYIPLYYVFRTAFIVWLFNPSTQGALFIYNKGLKNLFANRANIADKIYHQAEEILQDNKKAN